MALRVLQRETSRTQQVFVLRKSIIYGLIVRLRRLQGCGKRAQGVARINSPPSCRTYVIRGNFRREPRPPAGTAQRRRVVAKRYKCAIGG